MNHYLPYDVENPITTVGHSIHLDLDKMDPIRRKEYLNGNVEKYAHIILSGQKGGSVIKYRKTIRKKRMCKK